MFFFDYFKVFYVFNKIILATKNKIMFYLIYYKQLRFIKKRVIFVLNDFKKISIFPNLE